MRKKKLSTISAGAAQMTLVLDQQVNYQKMLEFIAEAARLKLELLVFPECALTGYPLEETDSYEHLDQRLLNRQIKQLKQLAQTQQMTIAFGAAITEQGRRWNRALLLGPDGRLRGVYDKIHLMPLDREFFAAGDALLTKGVHGVKMGLQICLDQRMPEPWRVLKLKGAQVVCHLAAAFGSGEWKMPIIEGCLRARASENGYFIVSANAAGPIQMIKSAIYDPRGLLLAQANYGVEQLIHAELDLSRINEGFPSKVDPQSFRA